MPTLGFTELQCTAAIGRTTKTEKGLAEEALQPPNIYAKSGQVVPKYITMKIPRNWDHIHGSSLGKELGWER